MPTLSLHDDLVVNFRDDGEPNGAPVVFAHALGTHLGLWEAILPFLPDGLRLLRYDMRGHGGSSVPAPPYSMGAMVRDAEGLCDALELRDVVFVGISIGGLVAQGLAAKRLDLVRGLVLSNTAPKIATRQIWEDRAEKVRSKGTGVLVDETLKRWFPKGIGGDVTRWRDAVLDCPDAGYAGCCAAIAGTDFYTPTASLRLPSQVIAGSEDGSTPPDLVRELATLIPGARFDLMRGSGHLPCVDAPQAYAAILTKFLSEIGHV